MMMLSVAIAFVTWLYVTTLREEVARYPGGNPPTIPINIVVLDADTGQPVVGARVDLPILHPSWRDRPEMNTGDLRKDHGHENWRPNPMITNGGGGAHTIMKASVKRRVKERFHGFIPVAGEPEVVFPFIIGLRVEADGYEAWAKFLNDLGPDDGRPLGNLNPMAITVRMKPIRGNSRP